MSSRLSRFGAVLLLAGAVSFPAGAGATVTNKPFGKLKDGTPIDLYTLKSGSLEAEIMNYGGIVVSLKVPDRSGKVADVVLGYDTLDDYVRNNPFFGAIVGRYGNRIAKGKFKLDGHEYALAVNNGENSLHGGTAGFDKRVWSGRIEGDALVLKYVSKDGEENYPGNLSTTVKYRLRTDGLRIEYTATTDKDTVVNLTNHSYFNLAGQDDVLNHEVTIQADRFTPVDQGLIPTGELRKVEGTPFDFRTPHRIGERISNEDEQLRFGQGYDHNWVLTRKGGELSLAARVSEPSTGRVMEVFTTEPGLQFYTGNFLDGTITGKGGKVYSRRSAFCMETQHFPDSPNHPSFPSTELKPGHTYHTITEYRFKTQ